MPGWPGRQRRKPKHPNTDTTSKNHLAVSLPWRGLVQEPAATPARLASLHSGSRLDSHCGGANARMVGGGAMPARSSQCMFTQGPQQSRGAVNPTNLREAGTWSRCLDSDPGPLRASRQGRMGGQRCKITSAKTRGARQGGVPGGTRHPRRIQKHPSRRLRAMEQPAAAIFSA